MSQTSFTDKQLRVTLILSPANSNGVFPETGSNTLTITGARMSANVQTVPGPSGASVTMDLKIYGMLQKDMNALTVVFFNVGAGQPLKFNNVIVETNDGSGWNQVFSGMIIEAQPVYAAMPNVYFQFQAVTGYEHLIAPVPPTTYQGTVPVASIVQTLAATMNYAFVNDGVTATITNPYLPGTNWDQLNKICRQTRTQYVVAGDTLAIYPLGKMRPSVPILVLSPTSGLEGYPTLEKFGIVVSTLYNKSLVAGGRVQVVDSVVPNANGLWCPFLVDHQLEANLPGGRWHTVAQCQPVPS